MLILAGVSIATLTGDNGILNRVSEAKEKTQISSEDELRKLTILEATTHLEDYEYEDSSGVKITIPAKCAVSQVEGENLIQNGLVIIDSNGNEWVWIVVPKSIYTTAESSTDYENIEKDMQRYANKYRSSYTDEWYSEAQHGFASAGEYNNHKDEMLKSVYENGGFYIGRYEVGIGENSYRNYGTDYSTEHPINETPVIQQDKYVYNWVRCSQAQELSESLTVGEKTSSLMFGIQWDLVLAYLESKGVSVADLNEDSGSWGNYSNVAFDITRGKYLTDYGANYTTVNGTYSKPESSVLLTTGATERNSKMNIYDLAGNVYEWTLEKSTNPNSPCARRGGNYSNNGSNDPVSYRSDLSTSRSVRTIGFRPALY